MIEGAGSLLGSWDVERVRPQHDPDSYHENDTQGPFELNDFAGPLMCASSGKVALQCLRCL
jgi:hypothetical protein